MRGTVKSPGGFTLIEIIAVLIILGVLAAVAIPKYMDLTGDARRRVLEGALAEGLSTVNVACAKLMLSNRGLATTSDIATYANANKPAGDEFSYTFTASATGVLVAVGGKAGSDFSGATAVTKMWENASSTSTTTTTVPTRRRRWWR